MRRTTGLILALTLLLGACTGAEGIARTREADRGSGQTSTTGTGSVGRPALGGFLAGGGVGIGAVALQRFGTCDSFLRWVRAGAAEQVGPYGLDPWGGYGFYAVEEMMAPQAMAADGSDSAGSGEQASFSTTNVQEVGVDEPDLVKTDGTRLYVMSAGTLYSIDVTDPSAPEVVDRIRVAGGDEGVTDMLLGPDRIYTIGTVWVPTEHPTDSSEFGDALTPPMWGRSEVVVTEIAVSPDGELSEASRLAVDGSYVAARMIGDGVRLVVRHEVGRLDFLYPSHQGSENEATKHNRRKVLESGIEDWIASYRLTTAAGDETSGLLTDCGRMTAPEEFSGTASLSVLTLDMTRPLDAGNAVTLLGAAETVYASTGSVYAATYAYPPMVPFDAAGNADSDPVPDFTTMIHQFDISDPAGASYVASGEVPGRLLNQWAMSEHEGHLRVAVTEGSPWWCCSSGTSTSSVVVLQRQGRDLVETGTVGDLGVGEDIVGVRFVGDTGYVVTFRFTDPLYVLDLSDPAAPSMAGELKITGYSAYLHPVGDGLLLGVGQEADLDGVTTGTKVSLFDVSDPARPDEVDRWVLPDSSSSVEWDHRGFLHWAPENLAVVPLDWGPGGIGAVALRIGDGTLEELGTISQQGGGGNWPGRVARSVVIGDVLWTVGEYVVQANDLVTLDRIGSVVL